MSALSKRLSVIASLVPSGARVCDIGTDHAYLGIELIKSGKAISVIACDINEKPLLKAKANIEKSGVNGIELRLQDGLAGIKPGDADCIVIAGIGAVSGWQWLIVAIGYIGIIFVMFSGARRLEIRQNKNYGKDPEYQKYVKTVPIMVPFIPLYSVEKYKWLVA